MSNSLTHLEKKKKKFFKDISLENYGIEMTDDEDGLLIEFFDGSFILIEKNYLYLSSLDHCNMEIISFLEYKINGLKFEMEYEDSETISFSFGFGKEQIIYNFLKENNKDNEIKISKVLIIIHQAINEKIENLLSSKSSDEKSPF